MIGWKGKWVEMRLIELQLARAQELWKGKSTRHSSQRQLQHLTFPGKTASIAVRNPSSNRVAVSWSVSDRVGTPHKHTQQSADHAFNLYNAGKAHLIE